MGNYTFSAAVMVEMRLNVWNTNPNVRRRMLARWLYRVFLVITSSPISIVPLVQESIKPIMFSNVVLPPPLGPRIMTNSPRRTGPKWRIVWFDLLCKEQLLDFNGGDIAEKPYRFALVRLSLSSLPLYDCYYSCVCRCVWEDNKLCSLSWSSCCCYRFSRISLPSLVLVSSALSFSYSHSVISFSAYTRSLECLIG